ncbi:hypothetical protein ABTX62_16775 [Streptomyces sp. NPDC096046]|uniref:hypothetical protein n=1 Tax=Streptomyces sp. NPDC096046 TaxID=3155542 RepID=UPI003326BF06
MHSAPTEIVGGGDDGSVRAVRVTGASGDALVPSTTVLRAIGFRGAPVPGLPSDEATGTVPHDKGRVTGLTGAYATPAHLPHHPAPKKIHRHQAGEGTPNATWPRRHVRS